MKKQGKTRLGFLFLGLLFFPIRLQAASPTHTIQQNIFLAKSGDFIVFSKGSQRIFILVKSASQDSVCLEIIDFPTLLYSERNLPQETSWKTAIHQLKSPAKVTVLYLSKKNIRAFSLCSKTSQLSPISNAQDLPLLSKFFTIPLEPAPKHLIKMKQDNLPWTPTVQIEEQKVSKPLTTKALHGTWPKDHTLLSETDILMYFPLPEVSVFPIWISIHLPTKGTSVLRALSVGHGSTSPYHYALPKDLELSK